MNTLKFRAWDNKNKKWLLGYDTGKLGGFSMIGEVMMFGEYTNMLNLFSIHDLDCIKIMQHTGLYDKNKNEIYEGDILNGFYRGKKIGDSDCIVFEHGKFKLKNTPDDLIKYTYSLSDYECEIIGNIYQNPELLKP